MNLPAWASPSHPIVRRELAVWNGYTRRWRWLAVLLILLPVGCSALCGLSGLPIALSENTTAAWALALGVGFIGGLWALHGFATWGLGLILNIGAATLIARERQTQNWELIRLTPLTVPDIVRAKIAALWLWLRWPIVLVLGLRVLGIVGTAAAAGIALIAAPQLDPAFTRAVQTALLIGLVPVALFGLGYFVVELAAGVLYNTALGLLGSALSRTSANAIALTFVLNFALGIAVFAPAQQIATAGIGLVAGLAPDQWQGVAVGVAVLIAFVLPLIIELILGGVALAISLDQARRLPE